MAANDVTAERTPNPIAHARAIRLIRIAVLFIAGVAIAFTAPMHEQLGFNTLITAFTLGAVGVSLFIEWFAIRPQSGSPVTLLLAVVALIAAVILPFTGSIIGFAVTVASWALASALLEFVGATTRERRDATLLGVLGILLSILILLVREDQVAILGFFGAYAFIAAVFLGISAFDSPQPRSPVESTR
ncbi:hypothetical protein G7067_02780 [Leucobacter insecticola]|uniref:DUF308 domain-containing protein n=1 Tax=Leucobacter insecticola TaxID=2714934 RepID=A0A6G8FGJ3_9MICO|nr:hypothetical protein [Leucobacter insecticola]QIM15580.1 hypothetical protein G7067_02780 [Leucobacter insecticola]